MTRLLGVQVQHRDTFRVDYVGGFASRGFSYFVARQRSSATADPGSPQRSYLARVCHADRSFASYVEVQYEDGCLVVASCWCNG